MGAAEAQLLERMKKYEEIEAQLLNERQKYQAAEEQLVELRGENEAVRQQLSEEIETHQPESDHEKKNTNLDDTTSDVIEEQKGTIIDLQSQVHELQVLEEKQKDVIRNIQTSLEKKESQSTLTVEQKNQCIEDLQAEVASLQEELRQKLESKEQSELKISDLEQLISKKDSDYLTNEERTKQEVQSLKVRSFDLERQLTEIRGELQQLQEHSTQLSQRLSTAEEETTQAVSTKIDIICTLAQEIEWLRNSSNGFVLIQKNLAQARLDRSSGPEYSTEPDMLSLEHSS